MKEVGCIKYKSIINDAPDAVTAEGVTPEKK